MPDFIQPTKIPLWAVTNKGFWISTKTISTYWIFLNTIFKRIFVQANLFARRMLAAQSELFVSQSRHYIPVFTSRLVAEMYFSHAYHSIKTIRNNRFVWRNVVIITFNCSPLDYDECEPTLTEHAEDCPKHSMCQNTFGSYTCNCAVGYEKHKSIDNFCVSEGTHNSSSLPMRGGGGWTARSWEKYAA